MARGRFKTHAKAAKGAAAARRPGAGRRHRGAVGGRRGPQRAAEGRRGLRSLPAWRQKLSYPGITTSRGFVYQDTGCVTKLTTPRYSHSNKEPKTPGLRERESACGLWTALDVLRRAHPRGAPKAGPPRSQNDGQSMEVDGAPRPLHHHAVVPCHWS